MIRKFVSAKIADEFLRLCEELPIMQYASSKRQRWNLEECSGREPWALSLRKRSTIPNHAKLSMWRGDEWFDYVNGRHVRYRMVKA